MQLSLIFVLCILVIQCLAGQTNQKGYIERVLFALIRKQSYDGNIADAFDWLLPGITSEAELKTAIENFPLVFKQNGNIVGSNLPLKVSGNSLTYDTGAISPDYTATNIYGDKVSITYTGTDTNTILGMMENQDTTTIQSMKTLLTSTVPAKDLGIVNSGPPLYRDAAGIFGNVDSVTSDMSNQYFKGLLKLQGVLQSNLDIFQNTVISKMIDQIVQLRTTYNIDMINRSNALVAAYQEWVADPNNIITNQADLKTAMPDVYDEFLNNGILKFTPQGAPNPINAKRTLASIRGLANAAKDHVVVRNILTNFQSLANSGELTYTGTNTDDFRAQAPGEATIVCV